MATLNKARLTTLYIIVIRFSDQPYSESIYMIYEIGLYTKQFVFYAPLGCNYFAD